MHSSVNSGLRSSVNQDDLNNFSANSGLAPERDELETSPFLEEAPYYHLHALKISEGELL